ncbi:hypothetical protein AHF37_00910 [Paragonimus kellicotti]|nr:hypothetical protein AHF37_00910 [Paragonimus kellicotti]
MHSVWVSNSFGSTLLFWCYYQLSFLLSSESNTSDHLATEPPFNLSKAYSIGKPNPFGSNITPIGLVVSIIVPVIALLFLILLAFLIAHFFCHRLRRGLKWKPVSRPVHLSSLSTAFQYFGSLRSKRYCECQTMKLTSSATAPNCTCGLANKSANELEQLNGLGVTRKRSTAGCGWSTEGEIEGLANLVTKIQLKSQGCFGQVWHGRLSQKLPTTNSSDEPLLLETDVAIKIFRPAQKESWETELTLFRIPGLAHPNILKFYGADQSMCTLWETVEECWDQDAEARLSAGCVAERLAALSRQPWSRYRSTGPSDLLPLHSYPQFTTVSFSPSGMSGQPTLMASRTIPVIQTSSRPANAARSISFSLSTSTATFLVQQIRVFSSVSLDTLPSMKNYDCVTFVFYLS